MGIIGRGLITVTGGSSSSSGGSMSGFSGVSLLEGLSGIIDLDNTNGSLLITTSGQVINLNPLFTPSSGQTINQILLNLVDLSGLAQYTADNQTVINGLSGNLTLTSANDGVLVTKQGQVITLSGLYTSLSGAFINQIYQDTLSLSGLISQNQSDATTLSGLITDNDLDILALILATQTNAGDIVTVSGITDGLPRTQTTIEGLSGVVNLSSPDGSVTIGTNTQTIELESLFNSNSGIIFDEVFETAIYASGFAEANAEDIDTLSGIISAINTDTQTSINGLSGSLTITSTNDGLAINEVGQDIQLTSLFTDASGQLVDQNTEDILTLGTEILDNTNAIDQLGIEIVGLSGVVDINITNIAQNAIDVASVSGQLEASTASLDFTTASGTTFIMHHGFNSNRFTWNIWSTGYSPERIVWPENVAPSGQNHVIVELAVPMDGYLTLNRVSV